MHQNAALCGNGFPHYQTTNLDLLQVGSIGTQQNKSD